MGKEHNVGLHGEWDQVMRPSFSCPKPSEEKDIRKVGLHWTDLRGYRGYDKDVWFINGDSEEDRKIKLERQKKIDAMPDKKTVSISLEVEKIDCSGRYWLTVESELALAKLFYEERIAAGYASEGFIDSLNTLLTNWYPSPINTNLLCNTTQYFSDWGRCGELHWERGGRCSPFYKKWQQYLAEGTLPDMSELFSRLMSTTEMKAILRKAAHEAGKELDESQLNLLASNQELAKVYVRPILDAIQASKESDSDPDSDQSSQSEATVSPAESLAVQMLTIDAVQRQIRKALNISVSDEMFMSMLQDPQFHEAAIKYIVDCILSVNLSVSDEMLLSMLQDPQFHETAVRYVMDHILSNPQQTSSNSNKTKIDKLINPVTPDQQQPQQPQDTSDSTPDQQQPQQSQTTSDSTPDQQSSTDSTSDQQQPQQPQQSQAASDPASDQQQSADSTLDQSSSDQA